MPASHDKSNLVPQLTKLCGSRAMCHAAVPHLAPESELHDASSPNSADKGDIRSYSRSQLVKLNETCSEDETAAMDDNTFIQHAQLSIGYHKDDDLHRLLLLSKGRSQWKKQGLDLLEVPALILNIEARGGSVHEKRSKNDLIAQLNVLLQTPNKEAERVAADLLRPLTAEEREVINNAVYGVGLAGEVLAAIKGTNISVQHQSMHRLQPGEWLNDETINFYFTMLCQHDSEFYYADPNQKRNYFSMLHFMDKLLNLGHPSKEGEYEYINVKKWLEAVPGGDVFELDKIFFLINIG